MRTIAIVNQKGGCGKTTTAINLGGVLAHLGHRTLLVDLDPQSHCAVGLGIPEDKIDLHIGDAMLAACSPAEAALIPAPTPLAEDPDSPADEDADEQPTGRRRIDDARLLWRIGKNLELIPSTMKLAGLEAARGGLANAEGRDQRLASVLDRFSDRFDWCLIDCPPAVGLLTFNALRAADEAIIPVETSFFAMRGAERQVRTIKSLARRLGGQTPFRILATMHNPTSSLACDLLGQLEKQFGERMIPCVIRLDAKLKEATTLGQPLIDYDVEAPGARDYAALAEYLLTGQPPKPGSRIVPLKSLIQTGAQLGPDGSEPAPLQVAGEIQGKPDFEVPAGVSSGGLALQPSRAADLAMRAQRIMARSAELHARRSLEDAPVEFSRLLSGTPLVPIADPEPARRVESPDAELGHIYGARETTRGVLFVHPARPTSRVCIAGDFNGWSDIATPMRFNSSLGVHEACVDLPMGRSEYRLVVDGQWIADPYNRNVTTNPFGDRNSIVIVTRPSLAALAGEGAD